MQTNNSLANVLLPGQLFNSTENSINALDHRIWHDVEFYVGDTWKIRRNVTINYGFRWSFYREPYSETNGQASFSLADWSASEAAANPSDACNGVVVVPGTNPCGAAAANLAALGIALPLSAGTPGPNRALVNNANHDIAPRIGVAWDIRGDGKMALRVGGGQFYQRELVGIGRNAFADGTVRHRCDGRADTGSGGALCPAPRCRRTRRKTLGSYSEQLAVERIAGARIGA